MKNNITALFLCLSAGLFAAEPANTIESCCKGKSASEKEACLVRRSLGEGGCAVEPKGKAACCSGETGGKHDCCAAMMAGKTGACCEEKSVEKEKDACCEAMDAAVFSKESIYQLDARFTDDSGRTVALGELRGRPVLLAMFFASCGYACPLQLQNMQAIRELLPAGVREQTAYVLVTFDVVRDTPAALKIYRDQRGLDAGWTLLHGDDGAVRELAALIGVKYKQDADGMFSHSNLVTVLNPKGEIVHQHIGLKGGLEETAAALAAAVQK